MQLVTLIISGKQGSGKTTTQDFVSQWAFKDGYRVEILNFADEIYRIHNFARGVLANYGFVDNKIKNGPLLQYLGTEWGRGTYGENVWVDVLKRKIEDTKKFDNKKVLVIVGDCRFRNEFDGFPEALRVRLECDKEIRKARCTMWRENDLHPSEVDLDGYAASEKFDLYVDTGKFPIDHASNLIIDQLKRKTWLEKRLLAGA